MFCYGTAIVSFFVKTALLCVPLSTTINQPKIDSPFDSFLLPGNSTGNCPNSSGNCGNYSDINLATFENNAFGLF